MEGGQPESPARPSEEQNEEKPSCVFYKDITCPVRVEMQKDVSTKAIERRMLPLAKGTDEQQMISKMMDAYKGIIDKFMGEFNELHSYCSICPIKKQKDIPAVAKCPQCGFDLSKLASPTSIK